MERRKLFETTRRRLFSETTKKTSPRRKLFCSHTHTLVCKDCGHEIVTTANSTNLVCPECGSSNRFNIKHERRKLFSQGVVNPEGNGEIHMFECLDCGEQFENISQTPSGVVCPKCGGSRVVQLEKEDVTDQEQHDELDSTGELLKEFSGKSIAKDDLQKLFTERGITDTVESFCDSGYASLNDEGLVCFSEHPEITRRLFSELVISVTKELRLVPTEGKIEELIHNLEERGTLSPKGLVLVKKTHGFIPPVNRQVGFSETDEYIKDSGIANDLKLEYTGQTMALREFMDLLDTQYNDAPKDLLDKLVELGIIKITGSQVEIL